MKLEFITQLFEKYSNIKYHKNQHSESRVVPCGGTDRHDEANSRSSQLLERANKCGAVFYNFTLLAKPRVTDDSSDCIFKVRAYCIC